MDDELQKKIITHFIKLLKQIEFNELMYGEGKVELGNRSIIVRKPQEGENESTK